MQLSLETGLIVIDVQEKLFRLMPERERLEQAMIQMVQGARALGLPIVWVEQYPEGMGRTISSLADRLVGQQPIPKKAFSCCGHPPVMDAIRATGRSRFALVGIETHVCVYQTARDLVQMGFHVEVVADAVASRTLENREIGLARIRQEGARVTSVEMCLFDLLGAAEGPAFKAVLPLVK